jgi:hypothetical protein
VFGKESRGDDVSVGLAVRIAGREQQQPRLVKLLAMLELEGVDQLHAL